VLLWVLLVVLSVLRVFVVEVHFLVVQVCVWVVVVVFLLFCLRNAFLHLYLFHASHTPQQVGGLRSAQLDFAVIPHFLWRGGWYWVLGLGHDAEPFDDDGRGLHVVVLLH
jgi:hypothetical protein